jgi:hypothetical protein
MADSTHPTTLPEFIEAIRAGLLCGLCGRYIGSLGPASYAPPPYPIALDKIGPDDEVAAQVGFEWHMLGRLREGNFIIRHPAVDGRCVSVREWLAREDEEAEADT